MKEMKTLKTILGIGLVGSLIWSLNRYSYTNEEVYEKGIVISETREIPKKNSKLLENYFLQKKYILEVNSGDKTYFLNIQEGIKGTFDVLDKTISPGDEIVFKVGNKLTNPRRKDKYFPSFQGDTINLWVKDLRINN